jgi:DNA-binding protein YbaB
MSEQQKPKKQRQPKSKRLNLNSKDKWEKLLKEVSKEQVPISVLRYITVNLKDGTSVDVNISEMIADGADPELVEKLINNKLEALDDVIQDVDFHISVDSVAKVIQPFTDKLLKDL